MHLSKGEIIVHSKGSLKIFGREGRIFRITLVIVMTGMMCVWGIVPSFSVYAEDQEAAASTEQSQQKIGRAHV